jgi:hypothetical protein
MVMSREKTFFFQIIAHPVPVGYQESNTYAGEHEMP